MRYISPLRYPGGKAKLGPYFARILADQSIQIDTYAEPYAGGAGAGLYLLSEGYISKLLINDLNPGIAAFWRSILTDSERFIERVETEELSLDSWHKNREIYLTPDGRNDLDLGFAAFFLNRCNRSGILTARPIGGLEQTGKWKIDARFNREDLATRIRHIASMAPQIVVTQKSALGFLATLSRRKRPVFLYVDPPYLTQGDELYMSSHSWPEHEQLAAALVKISHPWILTYDVDNRIRSLYPDNSCLQYSISHTAQTQKVGTEYMLFSGALKIGDIAVASNREGAWVD
ncbi:DNA adenine methylase [Nonomuraea polychroma]|uniref:DNA adenine methylase n=1 Tax=Nonomuraea polychroma TaxID=46176 RepID=UPI003D912BC6